MEKERHGQREAYTESTHRSGKEEATSYFLRAHGEYFPYPKRLTQCSNTLIFQLQGI